MWIRIWIPLLYFFGTVQSTSVNSCLNPGKVEDNVYLWEALFTKINTILTETSGLTEKINDLNENLRAMKERQNEQEAILKNAIESVQTRFLELETRQDERSSTVTNFMENAMMQLSLLQAGQEGGANFYDNVEKQLKDLENGQQSQDLILNEFMESVQENLKDFKEGRTNHDVAVTDLKESIEKKLNDIEIRQTEYGHSLNSLKDQYLSNNNEWTTILRRQDGSVSFNESWTSYKNGFGNENGEFFIGLEKLHKLTTTGSPKELLIIFIDYENEKRIAKYDLFKIGDETEHYTLEELGNYSGDAGDALIANEGKKFSTFDEDHDDVSENYAADYLGGWWFSDYFNTMLTGRYRQETDTAQSGIVWELWRKAVEDVPYKFVEMKIRPKTL